MIDEGYQTDSIKSSFNIEKGELFKNSMFKNENIKNKDIDLYMNMDMDNDYDNDYDYNSVHSRITKNNSNDNIKYSQYSDYSEYNLIEKSNFNQNQNTSTSTSSFKLQSNTSNYLQDIINKENKIKIKKSIDFQVNGSTYLKILEYYREEKKRFNKNGFKLEEMERFIKEYFDKKVQMKIKILQYIDSSLYLDVNFNTLPYVYMHKNYYLKNKIIYINEYKEVKGINSIGEDEKIMYIIKGVNVLEYKSCYCFIHIECQLKFTNELKIKQAIIDITDVEMVKFSSENEENDLLDLYNNKNMMSKVSLSDLKVRFLDVFCKFKSFMNELKRLILDLDYLNSV